MANYKKAPIVEAVLQLVFAEPLTEREVERAERKLKGNYSASNEIGDYQVEIRVGHSGAVPSVKGHKRWWQMLSSDGADILSLQREHFTVSRRAPYKKWEDLLSRVKRDFEQTSKIVGHRKFSRVGLRYVNRLDIPFDGRQPLDVKRYLNVYPSVPADIALPFLASHTRFEYIEPTLGATVVVTTGSVDPALINHHSYLLDVDVILMEDLPLRHADLFEKIEQLRPIKNSVFEAIITDETRRLIGG